MNKKGTGKTVFIKDINFTPFFKKKGDKLFQRIDISIDSTETKNASLNIKPYSRDISLLIKKGEQTYEIYLPEIFSSKKIEFLLAIKGKVADKKIAILKPQKKYNIFLIHYSHHDLGYTGLPLDVLSEYKTFYDNILKFCDRTNKFPAEAKFKYVVEQAWSILHFIKNASRKDVNKLIKYIKEGRIEVTALYGNLITELCGGEELIRALYPSFQLKRKYNIPLCSAELNDIPGISWGLVKILANSGIKYFSPGFPYWYFEKNNVHAFWDEKKVINLKIPGAFKWKGQDGSEVLFWYDIHGEELYLWDYNQALEDISDRLNSLEKYDYPFSIVSYTIRGGKRDNSPPSIKLSYIVKEWNEKWAFPKLTLSTNRIFFKELEKESKKKLSGFSGELPNTDYNIGAISSAKETGINRITHNILSSAEKFAAIASKLTDYLYPSETIKESYKNMLSYDEHTWGFSRLMGPAQEANWSEKSNFAYRASALSHGILIDSLNKIVDGIRLPTDSYYIAVFNPLSYPRTDIIRSVFKEYLHCKNPMHWKYCQNSFYMLVSGTAIGRNGVKLPLDILEKDFRLIDITTGAGVPYQIVKLNEPDAPLYYATERYALGQIDKKELFEIVFVGRDIPPMGYKIYRFLLSNKKKDFRNNISFTTNGIENTFYKITFNPKTASVTSIYDKQLKKEIIDKKSPHKFNQFIAKDIKTGKEKIPNMARIKKGESGPIYGSVKLYTKGDGCPKIVQEIILYNDIKKIDISNRILRDASPFLSHYFAFPFKIEKPKIIFEGVNSVIEPLKNQFPGSNTHYYSFQNWASLWDKKIGITFCSVEAPIVEFGNLHSEYVSGAHHCLTPKGYGREFINRFDKGSIYSFIMYNNFAVNFKNTQVSDCIFRYSFTSHKGDWKENKSYQFGWAVSNPLIPVYIKGKGKDKLKNYLSFCQINKPNVSLMTLKKAEDKNGLIVRLTETEGKDTVVRIALPFLEIKKAYLTNLVEENQRKVSAQKHIIKVPVKSFGITTVRVEEEVKS